MTRRLAASAGDGRGLPRPAWHLSSPLPFADCGRPRPRSATDDAIGLLAPNHVADIAIFAGNNKSRYRAVLEAEPKDVALVTICGEPTARSEGTPFAPIVACGMPFVSEQHQLSKSGCVSLKSR